MGLVAILLAAVAGFAMGAVWYMVNGARWMAAVGRSKAEIEADKSPLPFIVAGAAALVTAGMMRHVFASAGIAGAGAGLIGGLGIGAFLTAPWIMVNYAFAGRPKALWWIDMGHVVLVCGAIGLVLGLFL